MNLLGLGFITQKTIWFFLQAKDLIQSNSKDGKDEVNNFKFVSSKIVELET